eukprot:1160880-Pelagomonas_calceolata.AAC.2
MKAGAQMRTPSMAGKLLITCLLNNQIHIEGSAVCLRISWKSHAIGSQAVCMHGSSVTSSVGGQHGAPLGTICARISYVLAAIVPAFMLMHLSLHSCRHEAPLPPLCALVFTFTQPLSLPSCTCACLLRATHRALCALVDVSTQPLSLPSCMEPLFMLIRLCESQEDARTALATISAVRAASARLQGDLVPFMNQGGHNLAKAFTQRRPGALYEPRRVQSSFNPARHSLSMGSAEMCPLVHGDVCARRDVGLDAIQAGHTETHALLCTLDDLLPSMDRSKCNLAGAFAQMHGNGLELIQLEGSACC